MVVTVCRRGHVIDRSDFSSEETIREIQKALTVAPLADPQFNARPKKYPHFVWNANRTRLAVPRFFRHPAIDDLPRREAFGAVEARQNNMVFRGSLKPELRQPEAVAATLDSMRRTGGAILSLSPGQGKCFAKGTRVLMYDGSVRCVEDIGVGDVVMGDDWTPRIVASLGRGREMMYDIVPVDGGRPFTCNESHILALIHPKHDMKIDMDVKKCMSLSEPLQMYRRPPPDGSIVRTSFNIVQREVDDYYGFTLAGTEHRFLLADYTVVHNTVCALSIACTLGLKTLIIVHKEFLMNQWIERIGHFVPGARVGRLQQNRAEVEDRDVVVAMIHSVALRAYPPETFDGFGTTIVDESHHISAPVFSQAMRVANAPYVLGLTATPERKDGLQCVLHWCMGDIAFQTQRREQRHVRVRVARWTPPDGYAVPVTRFGKLNLPGMITELTENADRNRMLLDTIRELAAEGRKIIVLSDRRAHCEFLRDRIDATLGLAQGRQAALVGRAGLARQASLVGLYIGGMTEAELKASEACRVIVATYGLATEGLDIPALDTLVLATPKSDVVQASGRILRECAGKVNDPLIVDVVDAVGVCFAQFNKRKAFYRTAGFAVGDVTASEPTLAFLEDA